MTDPAVPVTPTIDYASHPGFRSFASPRTEFDDRVAELVALIDTGLAHASRSDPMQAATAWTDQTARHWNELIAYASHFDHGSCDTADRYRKAIRQAEIEMRSMVAYMTETPARPDDGDDCSRAVAAQIADDGIAVASVPEPTVAAIRDHLRASIAEVRQMADRAPLDRRSLPMPLQGKAWTRVWDALLDCGVVGGISLHERRQVKPMGWSLTLNTPSERWYKDCYADVGLETSPLAYMHYDHDFNYAKIQLYLSDVDLDSAPFSYIPGSHRWGGSPTQQMIFKTLDMAFASIPKPSGDVYYRTRFKYPDHRRQFMLLPTPLQGTSHFGDDVLADSDLARDLMARERFVTSDVGNCMVFTGGKALHRGGMAKSKERLVLQVGVAAAPPVSWSLEKKSLKQIAAERIGGMLRATIGDAATDALGRRVRSLIG